MLKAIGKFIDTTPLQKLLSQEEARADSVTIEMERRYGTHDLSEFLFVIRGITESGGEAEVCPAVTFNDETLWLSWEITPAFTKEAGTLRLDLFAYRYEEGADPEEDAPDYLIRFQLPPVQVRGLPDGTHVLDEKSYTAFLLQMRSARDSFLQELTDRSSDLWEQNRKLRSDLDAQSALLSAYNAKLHQLEARVIQLEQDFVPIHILTEGDYSTLPASDEDTLYVIKDE